jgi:hypothetical protein
MFADVARDGAPRRFALPFRRVLRGAHALAKRGTKPIERGVGRYPKYLSIASVRLLTWSF